MIGREERKRGRGRERGGVQNNTHKGITRRGNGNGEMEGEGEGMPTQKSHVITQQDSWNNFIFEEKKEFVSIEGGVDKRLISFLMEF